MCIGIQESIGTIFPTWYWSNHRCMTVTAGEWWSPWCARATIEATVKSLVTSLLRNGVLQRRGTEVHRT